MEYGVKITGSGRRSPGSESDLLVSYATLATSVSISLPHHPHQ